MNRRSFFKATFAVGISACSAYSWPAHAARNAQSFADWLDGFRRRAIAADLPAAAVDAALSSVAFDPRVLEKDRNQPEFYTPFVDYLQSVARPEVMSWGRRSLEEHAAIFVEVEELFDMDKAPLLGIWAQESEFGRLVRPYDVASALATLAFDPRRAAYFEFELNCLVRMHAQSAPNAPNPIEQTGSWAGAMGQPQFMPSAYLDYAVSTTAGAPDIWSNTRDVVYSVANYLRAHGWRRGLAWGQEVDASNIDLAAFPRAPGNGCRAHAKLSIEAPAAEWRRRGVNASPSLWGDDTRLQLVAAPGALARGFLVSSNYAVILRYNCSTHYALSAGLIADQLIS